MRLEHWCLNARLLAGFVGSAAPFLTLGLVIKEVLDLGGRAVVGDNVEALVVHVQDQVLTLCAMSAIVPTDHSWCSIP